MHRQQKQAVLIIYVSQPLLPSHLVEQVLEEVPRPVHGQ